MSNEADIGKFRYKHTHFANYVFILVIISRYKIQFISSQKCFCLFICLHKYWSLIFNNLDITSQLIAKARIDNISSVEVYNHKFNLFIGAGIKKIYILSDIIVSNM